MQTAAAQRYPFGACHTDAADRPAPAPAPAPPAEEEDQRTITDHALYLMLMVERPLYEEVSSSSGEDEDDDDADDDDDGDEERGVRGAEHGDGDAAGMQEEEPMDGVNTAPAADTAAEGGRPVPVPVPLPVPLPPVPARSSLKHALAPADRDRPEPRKKKKTVRWAKTASVRHYPPDSCPDGRRVGKETRRRARFRWGTASTTTDTEEEGEAGEWGG